MVAGHVPPDRPDHLVITIAAGHEPALASDQLRHRPSHLTLLASMGSVLPRCWHDLGVPGPGADPNLRGAGHRARWPAAGCAPARPPGSPAVHLPDCQPAPPSPPRPPGRGPVART